jgi:hypothetical protein
MTRYKAHEKADEGIYFNLRRLAFKSLEEPGRLPGNESDVYFRLPVLMVLPVGLLVSLAFLVFLPLVGFAMLAMLLIEKTGTGLRALARAASLARHPAHELGRHAR